MKILKHYILHYLLLLTLAGCENELPLTEDNLSTGIENNEELEPVPVHILAEPANMTVITGAQQRSPENPGLPQGFEISMGPQEETFGTLGTQQRSPDTMDPERENIIYDIIILQFNEEGLLLPRASTQIYYQQGVLRPAVEHSLIKMDHCSVCVIINASRSNDVLYLDQGYLYWKKSETEHVIIESTAEFRRILVDLPFTTKSPHHMSHMLMYGIYSGDIEKGKTLSTTLRRLCAKINIDLTNKTNRTFAGKVSLAGVSLQTSIMPLRAFYETKTTTFTDHVVLEANKTKRLYYYVGERINPPTPMLITVTDTINNLSAEVPMGSAPFAQTPNYNVYTNCYYTPTIVIRNDKP